MQVLDLRVLCVFLILHLLQDVQQPVRLQQRDVTQVRVKSTGLFEDQPLRLFIISGLDCKLVPVFCCKQLHSRAFIPEIGYKGQIVGGGRILFRLCILSPACAPTKHVKKLSWQQLSFPFSRQFFFPLTFPDTHKPQITDFYRVWSFSTFS